MARRLAPSPLPPISTLLRGAVACAALTALVGAAALRGSHVRATDLTLLRYARSLNASWNDWFFNLVAHSADVVPFLIVSVLLVGAAWRRGRSDLAIGAALALAGSSVSSQLLKHVLAQPRSTSWLSAAEIGDGAWPSGHATAATALVIAALIALPAGGRRVTALLALPYLALVSLALATMLWHYPSDIVGGWLLAATWGFTGASVATWIAASARSGQRRSDR